METKEEILTALNASFSALQNTALRFDHKTFNEKPTMNSWSPAQVVQHLVLAGSGVDKVLTGNTRPTEGKGDKQVAAIKELLLDFNLKLQAPAFIVPANEPYEREKLLSQLNTIEQSVAKLIPKLDLSATCMDFELPVYGHLTRMEAIYFMIYHTQRHTHQLHHMLEQ